MTRLIAGAGGVALIVSLFLPWAEAGGVSRSGWELWAGADVFLLLVGIFGVLTALSGGRFGLFRPDLSLRGATDLLGVVGTLLVAWLAFVDFPDGATREAGVFLALAGAASVMCATGDYAVLRGAPSFPRLRDDDRA